MSQAPTESAWVRALMRCITTDYELALNRNVRLRNMVLVLSETARRMIERAGRLEELDYYGVAVVVDAECGRPFEIVEIGE